MAHLRNILIRMVVVIISFSCINGAGFILLDRNDISILTGHNHPGDIESTHQHHLLTSHDEEKILESCFFDFSCRDNKSLKFSGNSDTPTQDYSVSVWQPPRVS
jgi:hypothetical protein